MNIIYKNQVDLQYSNIEENLGDMLSFRQANKIIKICCLEGSIFMSKY